MPTRFRLEHLSYHWLHIYHSVTGFRSYLVGECSSCYSEISECVESARTTVQVRQRCWRWKEIKNFFTCKEDINITSKLSILISLIILSLSSLLPFILSSSLPPQSALPPLSKNSAAPPSAHKSRHDLSPSTWPFHLLLCLPFAGRSLLSRTPSLL